MAEKKIRGVWYAGGAVWVLTKDLVHYTHKREFLDHPVRQRLLKQIRKAGVINTEHWNSKGRMSDQEIGAMYDAEIENTNEACGY
jgi:hypothetical protein